MNQAIALFCEDIREEKAGTVTLVGVMPDNTELPQVPVIFGKLCFYVRFHLEPGVDPGEVSVKLSFPDGNVTTLGGFEPDLVKKVIRGAADSGTPFAGLVFTAVAAPFPIPMPGRVVVIAKIGETETPCGALNFTLRQS